MYLKLFPRSLGKVCGFYDREWVFVPSLFPIVPYISISLFPIVPYTSIPSPFTAPEVLTNHPPFAMLPLASQKGRQLVGGKRRETMRTRISEALRKALGVEVEAEKSVNMGMFTTAPTTPPLTSQRAVPVVPEARETEEAEVGMIPLSEVLVNVMRPRLSSRSGKVNWEKTFERMRKIYDYLTYFTHKGYIKAKESGEEFDLLEAFYRIYPEARGQVKSFPVFVPNLLLDSESLERALDPKGNIFTYFSRIVDIPGSSSTMRARSGGSPDFHRLREEVTRAYNALVDPKGGENYREILARFLEAYLSYASKVRSLPKPEEG